MNATGEEAVMGEETAAGKMIRHLHELKAALDAEEFFTRIDCPMSVPPTLKVVNPAVHRLNETIQCGHNEADGGLWFFWSWGEPLCPAQDSHRAAKEIARVIAHRA